MTVSFVCRFRRRRRPAARVFFGLVLAAAGAALLTAAAPPPAHAQMVSGLDMPGFRGVLGLTSDKQAKGYKVVQIGASGLTNVLWAGEKPTFTFRVTNTSGAPLVARGRVEVIAYATSVPIGDIWVPHVRRLPGNAPAAPVSINIPVGDTTHPAYADVTLTPQIPARYGGYALVFDLGPQHGRAFGAAVARVLPADTKKERLPTFALDMPWPFQITENVNKTFFKLGTHACRMGAGYTPTTSPNFERDLAQLAQHLKWAAENNISVMLTLGAGSAPQPLGRGRPWLKPDGTMLENVKEDLAWLPEYDADFQKWVQIICSRWGWPRGPVNAVELWNEPWEGVSISGWGADLPRYREVYEHMGRGVLAARKAAGVQVLIGGASSSSNTLDKLFPDGSDKFLPLLDFVSIHYQEMSAVPSLVPSWMNRKQPGYGRVQVWDTESWVANSEDRLAAVIASMRAQGQDRTVGIYGGNVFESQSWDANGNGIGEDASKRKYTAVQAWAPAAAVAASQKFIGQRAFAGLLFPNGLPSVFTFRGRNGNADDGTIVVVGDLGGVYNRNKLLFRNVLGLKNAPRVAALRAKLAALPATATKDERDKLDQQWKAAQVLQGGSLTINDGGGQFRLLDFYGNPVASRGGKIVVPLNGLGYFLRTNGAKGTFARLRQAVASGRIEGYQPVEIVAHDFTSPFSADKRLPSGLIVTKNALRLSVTNVLNRPISGTLLARINGGLMNHTSSLVKMAPHETKMFTLGVLPSATSTNTYKLEARFNAGKDGFAEHEENLHVNVVAKKTITVDGKLDDWAGALPQPISGAGIGASLTEQAYLPFRNFATGAGAGQATGYLAYDRNNFYFAAKIADTSPYAGNVRFATRDDDQYYYPETVKERDKTRTWPAGVRRFSYRRDPDLPSGNGTDNVQIAFNVLPDAKKPWRMNPPGTPPRWMAYPDTDYEFALNQVAPEHGGGTEVWRLFAPGTPRKHFYPRQPKAKKDGGPVTTGKLEMRREGNTRIVECAIPWSEIPEVRAKMQAGQPIKFSFRVNDNDGPAYELANDRSVSKENFLAFHNDWATHWANEVEFGWEK